MTSRADKEKSLQNWRNEAFSLATNDCMGNVFTKILELSHVIVRKGVHAPNLDYYVKSLEAERILAREKDENRDYPMRSLMYGICEAIGFVLEGALEMRDASLFDDQSSLIVHDENGDQSAIAKEEERSSPSPPLFEAAQDDDNKEEIGMIEASDAPGTSRPDEPCTSRPSAFLSPPLGEESMNGGSLVSLAANRAQRPAPAAKPTAAAAISFRKENSHACRQCDAAFATAGLLRAHGKAHGYPCEFCGLLVNSLDGMDAHIKKRHADIIADPEDVGRAVRAAMAAEFALPRTSGGKTTATTKKKKAAETKGRKAKVPRVDSPPES